jgi:hypothetical protein
MNDFLPTNYEVPTISNYMKFKPGDNRFRILGSSITGWLWWIDGENGGRKPVRIPMTGKIAGGVEDVKHFWAFPVWNYADKKVQILELTQKTIQRSIQALVKNLKWGDPKMYDIVVTKTGDGMETEYNTTPDPKESLEEAIESLYRETTIDLQALYSGNDPFKKENVADDAIKAGI